MKKILSLILTLVVLLTSFLPTVVSAETNSMNLIKTRDGFEQLKEKHELGEVNLRNVSNQDILEFDSLEELEQFITELKKPKEFEQSIDLSNPATAPEFKTYLNSNVSPASTTYNGSHVINWWAPFSGWGMTGLACWRNISFEYKYNFVSGKPRFKEAVGSADQNHKTF